MKRIFIALGLLLITFALVGCDLTSDEDIQRTTEEICLENPDNEICQIDQFLIIQEHIDDGFDMFVEDFENDEITDDEFCAKWFNGIDEDCDGVTDTRFKFKAGAALAKSVNVVDIGDVENGMVEAKIEFILDGHVTVLRMALSITLEDGVIVYQIKDETILLQGIEKSDIRRSVELFIEDYSDIDMTDDELCAKWYDGLDNDCDGLVKARVKFKAGADLAKKVNIMNDVDDDGFGDIVAVIQFDQNGHVTVLKIAFDVTELNGVLKLTIKEENVVLRDYFEEDIRNQVMMFINDFENPNITSEQLCSKWYNNVDNDCDDVDDDRRRFKAGAALSKKVNIIEPVDEDDLVYALVEFEFNGHVTVLKISLTITEGEAGVPIVLMIEEAKVQGDYNTFIETEMVSMYRMYIEDYLDSTISFEEINNMYFDNKMDDEFGRLRELDIENEIEINVISDNVIEKDDLGYFILSLEIVTNNGNLYEEISLKPIRLELSRIDINPGSVQGDYYSIEEVEEFFKSFLLDYLDPDSDGDTISDSYFGGAIDPAFLTQRGIYIDSGTTVSMIGISAQSNYIIDSFFDVEYRIETGDSGTTGRVKIRVNRIDMALVIDTDDDGDSVPTEDLRMMIDGFISIYNDPLITDINACSSIKVIADADGTVDSTCETTRNGEMSNGNIITSYELFGDPDFGFANTFLFGDPDFLYSVDFIFGDPDFDLYRSFTLSVITNIEGNSEIELIEMNNSIINRADILTRISDFELLLSDPTNTADTICTTLFDDVSYSDCSILVNTVTEGSYTVQINEVYNFGDSYGLEMVLENAIGELVEIDIIMSFYMDTDIISVMLHIKNEGTN